MGAELFFKLIGELGVPIAFAGILLWFFLNNVKTLTKQNQRLLDELTQIREHHQSSVHAQEINGRLMEQNERLVDSVRSKEQAFIELLREVSIANHAGPPGADRRPAADDPRPNDPGPNNDGDAGDGR